MRFVTHGENTTFKVTAGEERFLLRVHQPMRHGRFVDSGAAIRSELRWMDGRRHAESARPGQLRLLGEAMAKLHHHADKWLPPKDFVRIRWDWETFFGDTMEYGGMNAAKVWELLPASLRRDFEHVAETARHVMADSDDFGLIHADLHLDNALFAGGGVKLIGLWIAGTAQVNPVFHDRLDQELTAVQRRLAALG